VSLTRLLISDPRARPLTQPANARRALAKAGYSVLQLDQSPYYGDQWASLSLQELIDYSASPAADTSPAPASPPAELVQLSSRFNLSLEPALLRATGPGIDLLVRSRVATYLSFGLLRGIGLWRHAEGAASADGAFELVPGTKADVFNHKGLGLVEKRRLTKLLLWAAGTGSLDEDELLKGQSRGARCQGRLVEGKLEYKGLTT